MKTIIAVLLFSVMAVKAQQVFISPVIHDTNYGDYHLIIGEQFHDNVASLQESGDMVNWYTSAVWGCNQNPDQFIAASFPAWLPHAFFRSMNEPCSTVATLGEVDGWLTETESAFRFTIRGTVYRLEPMSQDAFSLVRRFVCVPAM